MSREAKFTFQKILVNQMRDDDYYVSLNSKGQLYIPKSFLSQNDFKNSIVEFIEDPAKHALGFRKLNLEGLDAAEFRKNRRKTIRKFTANSSGGSTVVTIKKILESTLPNAVGKKISSLPLRSYNDGSSEIWYFIIK